MECLGSVDEAPAEETSGRGERNLWSYNSSSCLAELPSSVGPQNAQETHTSTHTFTLIFVPQSVLSLSLARSCMPFPDVCLSVRSLGLYSPLCLNHVTCLTSEMSHVRGFGGGEEDKGRLGKLTLVGWCCLGCCSRFNVANICPKA